MKSDHDTKMLFSDHEFVGNILRWTTILESHLDCTLTQYFSRADRLDETLNMFMPEISFSRKIEILARLPIRKKLKNHKTAIDGLRRFKRVRNIVAHSWTISLKHVRDLLNGEDYRIMLHYYPSGTQKIFAKTRNALDGLARSKEFVDKNRRNMSPIANNLIMKIFE